MSRRAPASSFTSPLTSGQNAYKGGPGSTDMADRRAPADASKLDITVDTKEDEPTLAKCHDQSQSVLFDKLPREIRDNIWAYATAQTEDPNHLYEKNRFYCRPGHTARHRTSTTLLYTCRRVWLEAHMLPMLQAEHCFWYYRNAPDGRDAKWMAKLTAMNRRDFGELHLFAQMFFIERLQAHTGSLRRFFLSTEPEPEDFQPRSLHVTIRHTDWWFWVSGYVVACLPSGLHLQSIRSRLLLTLVSSS